MRWFRERFNWIWQKGTAYEDYAYGENWEKYQEKGFEIIGVSADRNKAALTGTMSQKGISWPNLYDKEQQASLVESFNIQSFPTLMLLDQTGTVVAMNTRGEELEKAVAKLLDGKDD